MGVFKDLIDKRSIMAGYLEDGVCFLVPGPVRMNDSVLSAMSKPVMTARGPEFRDVMAELNSLLRIAFNLSPSIAQRGEESWAGEDGYRVIVVSGSGTAATEMAIANRFSQHDKVLVPSNGKFGERVAEITSRYCDCTHLRYDWGKAFDLNEVGEQLQSGDFEALIICHNETSTGITQDAETLSELCKKHNVSFLLDAITSVGGIPVHPEKWGAEAVVVGAQKCTAGPSGIAALAVSEEWVAQVDSRRKQGSANPTYYLDAVAALKKGDDDQTPWTPAINLCMGWSASLRTLAEEGLQERWKRCRDLAEGVRSLFASLGFQFLSDENQRSNTVTALMYPDGIDETWRSRLQSDYQTFVIGAQDHLKGKMFRIGSMGETSKEEMIEGCRRMLTCFRESGLSISEEIDVLGFFQG